MAYDYEKVEAINNWNIYGILSDDYEAGLAKKGKSIEDDDSFKLSDLIPPTDDNLIWADCLAAANKDCLQAEILYKKRPYSYVKRVLATVAALNYQPPLEEN